MSVTQPLVFMTVCYGLRQSSMIYKMWEFPRSGHQVVLNARQTIYECWNLQGVATKLYVALACDKVSGSHQVMINAIVHGWESWRQGTATSAATFQPGMGHRWGSRHQSTARNSS